MAINIETITKYIVDKNLFLKAFCVFVSAYSMSVIYSLWNNTGLSGLMGISKFLEWIHFDALARPVADVATFLQRDPWAGGGGIIAGFAMFGLLSSAVQMEGAKRGELQFPVSTLWSFVVIDFNAPWYIPSLIIFYIIASYRLNDRFSVRSFFELLVFIFLSIAYIPLILMLLIGGNVKTQK